MQVRKISLLLAVITIILSVVYSIKIEAQTATQINSVVTIIDDMKSPHADPPHGVPKHYSWAKGPNIGMGNNPNNFKAMVAWGQLYEAEKGNPATNTRVQIRNIKAYSLSKKDKKWHLLQESTGADGSAYREDFAGDANKSPDVRQESDSTISVKAGNGYNFHFWTKGGRANINPNDIGGIYTTVQARLITDNSQKKDDREQARYLLNMGGDYWLDLSAGWDNFKTNGGIAMGRFKYVTTNWQAFNMTTLSSEEILRNPPPVE